MFQEAKCAEKQRVLKSKWGWGVECSKEQSIPGRKVFQGAKCAMEQRVLRSKGFSLLFNTFGSLEPFAPENTLLFNTFCSLEHFASLHLLLPGTLSSPVYFPFQHILLLRILLTMILIIKNRCLTPTLG